MERCPNCNLQYKRNNRYNQELTSTQLAANSQYYCQQCEKILNLADKSFHLQPNEQKNIKRMWFCEACKKDINNNTKSSFIKSAALIENEVFSRINNILTDKTYTYINPNFEQVDIVIKRAIDECTQHFHRFKNKCELVVKFNHATPGNTNYFTLTNKFKNQHEEVNEANELNHQIDEFEQGESGYIFNIIKKLTVKMFRYHEKRASSCCKVPESFCSSTSIVNIEKR